jgi:hypothetical protein
MLGIHEFTLPLVLDGAERRMGGPRSTTIPRARERGGLAGFMHPYIASPLTPAAAASTDRLDVALGWRLLRHLVALLR